jgi:hypothetical protein
VRHAYLLTVTYETLIIVFWKRIITLQTEAVKGAAPIASVIEFSNARAPLDGQLASTAAQ